MPLFIKQEGCHINRNLQMHRAGAIFHRLFLQQTQQMQRERFRAAHMTGAGATRTGDVAGFAQTGLQALTR